MKTSTFLFAVLFLAGTAFASDYTGGEGKEKNKEMTLNVSGMVCGACEERVSTQLKTLEGVETVEASHDQNQVRIVLTGDHASGEEITQAIKDAGFEVVKDNPEKKRKKDRGDE
jgi:copper chaperone CopZ